MTTILYLLAVALVSGVVWLVMLAYERWQSRHRLSDGLLRTYHRAAMRESAPQFVTWPTPEEREARSKP